MKYCTHCGNQLSDDVNICPRCGTFVGSNQNYPTSAVNYTNQPALQNSGSKTAQVLGVLSVVFGALGGLAGLVLGIIGLCIDKEHKYKVLNIIGIVLASVWILIYIIINVISIAM